MQIIPIPYFNDNYAYAVKYDTKACYLFDAGDGREIAERLKELQLTPSILFITHNHHDHSDGIEDLKSIFPNLTVITPERAHRNDFEAPEVTVEPIYSPGHTADHVCYYLPTCKALITGDTIFAGGTGRCFTGDFPLYCKSLNRLTMLPGETKLYGAHEYLAANRAFISSINEETSFYENRLSEERFPSVGIELSGELQHSPLLRACYKSDIEEFTRLRKLKDNF